MVNSLTDALALRPREHIALVGGGGKTTLMFALANELKRNGKRVITSTTTKVRHSEALEYDKVLLVDDDADWKSKAKEALGQGTVFVGRSILDSGKAEGISASRADEIFCNSNVQCLVVEADGSAGHPLKAPAEHEPVIPSSVTMVVAMMGLEAMSTRLDEATAFRVEQVSQVTNLETGGILTPKAIAGVFLHPAGLFKGTPEGARRVVLLNKADLIKHERKAEELADILLADAAKKIDRVVFGSLKMGVYQIKTKKDET